MKYLLTETYLSYLCTSLIPPYTKLDCVQHERTIELLAAISCIQTTILVLITEASYCYGDVCTEHNQTEAKTTNNNNITNNEIISHLQ